MPAVSSPAEAAKSSQQDDSLPLSSPIRQNRPPASVVDVKPSTAALNGHVLPVTDGPPINSLQNSIRVKTEVTPIKDEDDIIDDVSDVSDDEDSGEENPFELFASTQLPREIVKADINQHMISRSGLEDIGEEDEEEIRMQQHEQDARQRAEDGKRFRATQATQRQDESDDEYGDDELDELFRRTVMGGYSNQTTPRKDRGSTTPTTGSRSGMSSGGMEARRRQREARLMEQAGLGDLRCAFPNDNRAELITV